MIISDSTNNHRSMGATQAGGSSSARWLRCGGAAGRRRPCAHRGKEAWSGAQALRKYTSNANAKMGNCACEQ
eukprot:3011925-Pleurochrysis_carterae.AAC.2